MLTNTCVPSHVSEARLSGWNPLVVLMATTVIMGLASSASHAVDSTVPGVISAPFPTFRYLSVDWPISGDDNRNATVDVRYKPVGTGTWNNSMGLRRISAGSNVGFSWSNKLSGSLFDLQPGTNYDIELTLNDPDGGSTVQTIQQSTRALPNFSNAIVTEFPGVSFGAFVPQSGTAAQPRLYRSIDANNPAKFIQLDLRGKEHVYFQNVEVNAPGGTAVLAHSASNIGILNSTINAQFGIVAKGSGGDTGVANGYFADNVITGETVWAESSLGVNGNNVGDGIQITGPGNVIAYNKVSGFRDAISTFESVGNVVNQVSLDIYGNDISVGADDAIEADFCQGNCRIIGNRITDSFIGISSQPSLGGPAYIMRNAMYNIAFTGLKLNRNSEGDVVIHNTIVKVGSGLTNFTSDDFDHTLFRNNLAIGGVDVGTIGGFDPGNSRGADLRRCLSDCDIDYDTVGVTTEANPINSSRIYIGGVSTPFNTVEANGLIIDGLSAADLAPLFPGVSQPTTKAGVLTLHAAQDLRPGTASEVIDNAELIPGINDNFLGSGPDRGAYEAGAPLPHYGPRSQLAELLGDYNNDGTVDAADYTVWLDNFGSGSELPNDGDLGTPVGQAHYTQWKANFGNQSSSGSATNANIPEPTSLALLAIACILGAWASRNSRLSQCVSEQ